MVCFLRKLLNMLHRAAWGACVASLWLVCVQRSSAQAEPASSATSAQELNEQANDFESLGLMCMNAAKFQAAIDAFNQALPFFRQAGNRKGEAIVLNEIGEANRGLGNMPAALDSYRKAFDIVQELDDKAGEAAALNNMGLAYQALGQIQDAMDAYDRAIPLAQKAGDAAPAALLLANQAALYQQLGQKQKALDLYARAQPVFHENGDLGETTVMDSMAAIYLSQGQPQRALDLLLQSKQMRDYNFGHADRLTQTRELENIASAYSALGQGEEALSFFEQALADQHDMVDAQGEAYTLDAMGALLYRAGDKASLPYFELAALSLSIQAKDPDIQGEIDTSLMRYFRDIGAPELAIFFGIEGANAFQQIRQNMTGLDKETQAGFAQSKSSTYRQLAELLVQADRLGEAEQVLDLLKEQELKEVVRGAPADAAAKVQPLRLSAAEQSVEQGLAAPEELAASLVPLLIEREALQNKASLNPQEQSRLRSVRAEILQNTGKIVAIFRDTIIPKLAPSSSAAVSEAADSAQSYLQETLSTLGPQVMGIRFLFGEEHAYAIVVTARDRHKVELKATPSELRAKVLEVREALRTRDPNATSKLAELYAALIAPVDPWLKPLEADQAQGHTPTLLWSLDGVLRYVPVAALYDGQRYMVERFNNVLFTPHSYGQMSASPHDGATSLRVLAMGLSKSYGGMPPLPGVMQELDAIARDASVPQSHGPLEGKLLPNDEFTLTAWTELARERNFSIVHIASHFVAGSSDGSEPYLMLGGQDVAGPAGYALTLSRLEDPNINFKGTQLLTFSACSTATDYTTQNGIEMDSLGMVAQQKGAAAVLSTLWDVNDASTSLLMSDFYWRWATTPGIEKAEALRQAQLAMLHGTARTETPTSATGRGITDSADSAASTPAYAHPYYWAPFVLVGNFR